MSVTSNRASSYALLFQYEFLMIVSLISLCLRFPDKEVGQFPMAYVVRKTGSTISESAVMDFIAKQVILE